MNPSVFVCNRWAGNPAKVCPRQEVKRLRFDDALKDWYPWVKAQLGEKVVILDMPETTPIIDDWLEILGTQATRFF
jgi:hypothetical protein